MTHKERLAEIERRLSDQLARCIGGSFTAIQYAKYEFSENAEKDIDYLITRVRVLTEALEEIIAKAALMILIENGDHIDHFLENARKALEDT